MNNNNIVSTISQKCKRCYSCIRECPAHAIRVLNGQAVVVGERCIGCGHCVKVCSQHAKRIKNEVDRVIELLSNEKVVAIIAPSFAATFPNTYNKIPGALKKVGFQSVTETAFGADLISQLYAQELEQSDGRTIISSACPAVYNYIEKYFEGLVPNLAKIVSPMIAMGRYLKANLGEDIKVVFIGPCVAKKSEYEDEQVKGAIDAVLTFTELKELFLIKEINLLEIEDSELDPPYANLGKSFPLAGGLLKTANISTDILEKEIIVVEGKDKVVEIMHEIADHQLNAKLVDVLFCEGCISGPAIDSDYNYYFRREKVIKYIDEKANLVDKQIWKSNIYNSRTIDFTRDFSYKHQRKPMPSEEKIKEILAQTNKLSKQDELNCTACGYESCREYAIAIAKGLAEDEMCLPFLIDKLEKAYDDLKTTQEQLHSAEKLASIGQLAAGVAHEINNPLGTIMLYSSMLNKELSKLESGKQYSEDLGLILDEAKRCKNIVADLLNFARQGKLKLADVNIIEIISSIVKTIFINPAFKGISISLHNDVDEPVIRADEDQIKQVFLNIINNACEAMEDRPNKKIEIRITKVNEQLVIDIADSGCGIPKDYMSKLFTPFFTTKKMGKGTGLGLPITYGIIKMHRGDIKVQSISGEGTTFTIKLPINLTANQIITN
ncbi:MAG: GHKL domain-containing protein [Ignavibacteriales bacterium]|nr:MAG: GHKL domain-containing protein [Ignavibacteriales bacterium]